jgi:hypothetical protein
LESKRLKLTAICTVCAKHVVKEITEMDEYLRSLQPAKTLLAKHTTSVAAGVNGSN